MEGITQRALIIDTSAIIAEIKGEPGSEVVRKILNEPPSGGLYMHTVNVCEVAYKLIIFGFLEHVAFHLATPKGIEIVERILPPVWKRAASLKTRYQHLSLGDCILIAQAEMFNADILTGDRAFQQVSTHIAVKLFR